MREIGTIISVERGRAMVRIDRGSQCNGCTACKSFGENNMQIEALNRPNGQVGDLVEVMIEPAKVVKHSFIVFILPLLMMVLGYLAGGTLYPVRQESAGIAGSLAGLVLAFLLIRLFDRRASRSAENDAVIVDVLTFPAHKQD